ncbi:hypothetical protein Vpro01_00878 [Vibrio proteolyticus]
MALYQSHNLINGLTQQPLNNTTSYKCIKSRHIFTKYADFCYDYSTLSYDK